MTDEPELPESLTPYPVNPRDSAAKRVHDLLVHLWDKAKDHPENYVKADWNALHNAISELEHPDPRPHRRR